MNKIIEDDILDFKDNSFLMTHTTSPLINPLTLSMAKLKYEEVLRKNSHDSLFSVNSHKSRFFDSLGTPMNHDLKSLIPTQNLIPIYEENSAFYFFSYESFFRFKSRIGSRPYFYVTPKIESVDIDDSETWNLALTIKRGLNDNA
jgi:CMP-N-acetylneuraminic acid synthetase